MKKSIFTFYICAAVFLLGLTLGVGQPAMASIPSTRDFVTEGWKAYDEGRFSDAVKVWELLAGQGDINAQINLAIMYESGQGVAVDSAKAFTWYLAAAEKGSPDAQYSLGLMFNAGRGVKRDITRAAYWLYKAALHNLPMAQYELGLLYGEGLDRDKHGFLPKDHPTDLTGTTTVTDGLELAIQWFFASGLSYLSQGDSKGAWQSVSAIKEISSIHPLKQALEERINSCMSRENPAQPSRSFAGGSVGTGWPISTGYVVTNSHVVEESTDVLLISETGQEIKAWTVLRDEANDIALLEVGDIAKLPPAIPLSGSQADLGASVFTVGYPRIDVLGDSPKQSQGAISQLHGLQDDPLSYQTTVPIQPGNSGGPLINMHGEAVGVIKAMIGVRDEIKGNVEPLPNASCALKIEGLKELAQLLPQQKPLLGELSHEPEDMSTLTARIKGSVLIVVAR